MLIAPAIAQMFIADNRGAEACERAHHAIVDGT
jgi:hypothetical protein